MQANAITFTGGTNTLTLHSGFTITSNVVADDVASTDDTLALGGAAAGAFNVSTIGASAQYRGFETFQVDGGVWTLSGTTTTNWSVNGGTLGGTATLGAVTINGGTLAPGASPGILNTGNLSFAGGGILEIEIGGTTAGQYDQVNVIGTVNLIGATLTTALLGGFQPATNGTFTIIDNDGTDTVMGIFAGLAEGAVISIGGGTFSISYMGGTGNDVVLTALNDAPVITSNGGGATASIDTQENTTAVTTVTADDPDSGSLTFSIVGGADETKFTIDATTGALSFVDAPNFEQPGDADADNSYVVQVRVTDGSLTDEQTITVNVTNVVEPTKGQDFNADGFADIFWQVDGGALAVWEMSGEQIAAADYTRAGSSAVGRPGADWHIVDTGDFGGDGRSDVLWRTGSGALALWEMDGNQIVAADYVRNGSAQLNAPGADWHALGALDADGDSKSDILWRTDSGALAIWAMDGNQLKSADYIRAGATAIGQPGADWNIVGTGDFDGDGKSDILWHTDDGKLAVWHLDGTQLKSADYLKAGSSTVGAPGADWHVSDVADFNADGRADILWRIGAAQTGDLPPGGGQVAIWLMNGNQIEAADYTRTGSTAVGAPGNDWHLLGADDHSGDGMADLLWQTDSGALAIWEMDGTQVTDAGYTRTGSANAGAPGTDWHVYQHHYDLV